MIFREEAALKLGTPLGNGSLEPREMALEATCSMTPTPTLNSKGTGRVVLATRTCIAPVSLVLDGYMHLDAQ